MWIDNITNALFYILFDIRSFIRIFLILNFIIIIIVLVHVVGRILLRVMRVVRVICLRVHVFFSVIVLDLAFVIMVVTTVV